MTSSARRVSSSVWNRQQNLRSAGRWRSRSIWPGMPNKWQHTAVIRPKATAHHGYGGHRLASDSRTAALLSAGSYLYSLDQGTRRGGSIGINFAIRFWCYRNLNGSYSVRYELLPVARILILEDHRGTGFGRDTARAGLLTSGQKGLYARSATIPRAVHATGIALGASATLADSRLRPCVSSFLSK